jgi:pyruvate,water dikinase
MCRGVEKLANSEKEEDIMSKKFKYIRFFKDLGMNDVPLVGGKTASLGEMYRELAPKGVKVPNGFGITADAYRYILDKANAWKDLHLALDGVESSNLSTAHRI